MWMMESTFPYSKPWLRNDTGVSGSLSVEIRWFDISDKSIVSLLDENERIA
jgi:hypothetical protein